MSFISFGFRRRVSYSGAYAPVILPTEGRFHSRARTTLIQLVCQRPNVYLAVRELFFFVWTQSACFIPRVRIPVRANGMHLSSAKTKVRRPLAV